MVDDRAEIDIRGSQNLAGEDDAGNVGIFPEKGPLRELFLQIGQRCRELTDNPQANIDPSDIFQWQLKRDGTVDKRAVNRLLRNPKLPKGVSIEGAVELPTNRGKLAFVILRDSASSNMISVIRSTGITQAIRSIAETVPVAPDHVEISFTTLRKPSDGSEPRFHRERAVIGSSTAESWRLGTIGFDDPGRYRFLRGQFSSLVALSDLPIGFIPGEFPVAPTEADFQAILDLLNDGRVDAKAMAQAIAHEQTASKFRTPTESGGM